MFILHSKPETQHAMAYQAIYEYADPEALTVNHDFIVPPGGGSKILEFSRYEKVGVDNTIYKMSEAADLEKIDKHNLPDINNNGRTYSLDRRVLTRSSSV